MRHDQTSIILAGVPPADEEIPPGGGNPRAFRHEVSQRHVAAVGGRTPLAFVMHPTHGCCGSVPHS